MKKIALIILACTIYMVGNAQIEMNTYGNVTCALSLMEANLISGTYGGSFYKYSITVKSYMPASDVFMHTKNLKIEGPFYMGVGKTLSIKPDYLINCK